MDELCGASEGKSNMRNTNGWGFNVENVRSASIYRFLLLFRIFIGYLYAAHLLAPIISREIWSMQLVRCNIGGKNVSVWCRHTAHTTHTRHSELCDAACHMHIPIPWINCLDLVVEGARLRKSMFPRSCRQLTALKFKFGVWKQYDLVFAQHYIEEWERKDYDENDGKKNIVPDKWSRRIIWMITMYGIVYTGIQSDDMQKWLWLTVIIFDKAHIAYRGE